MSDATNTKPQFRVLYRQFLFRVVDLDILSAHALGDANKLLGQFAALLIVISAGIGLVPLFMDKNMAPPARLDLMLQIEHQLITMTMLVVGIFAVLSWDSTFPDRRDVLVLAPLPVRPRTMFFAKVAATATALALVVVLLHCVAGLTWPFAFALLAPANSRLFQAVRWFLAYWFTMLAAGTFIYCSVLAIQGLAAQILPRRLFLRASVFLQIAAFCLFVSVYFLEPPVEWFSALLGDLTGSRNPAMATLARRAWLGLAITAFAAAAAYALSYTRTIRQILEEPDITSARRRFRWLPCFGNRVQTAIGQFGVRTLARSRQHRLILAFYLGVGFAFTIPLLSLLAAPQTRGGPVSNIWHRPNEPFLAANVMMMALVVLGLRVVFAFPLELRANWIFRAVGLHDEGEIRVATRRVLFLLSVAPVWLVSVGVCFWLWPWHQAMAHLVVLGLLGIILADLSLWGFRKIPFTCSYLPGKSKVHLIVAAAVILISLVAQCVVWEQEALQKPGMMAAMLALLGVATVVIRWRTTVLTRSDEEGLQFEEEGTPAVLELGLYRDGAALGSGPPNPHSS
jgi:hypothetical protein